jgi:hypothetical protein
MGWDGEAGLQHRMGPIRISPMAKEVGDRVRCWIFFQHLFQLYVFEEGVVTR